MFQKTKSGSFHIRRGQVVRRPGPRGGAGRRSTLRGGLEGLPEQRSRVWPPESGRPGSEGLRVSPVCGRARRPPQRVPHLTCTELRGALRGVKGPREALVTAITTAWQKRVVGPEEGQAGSWPAGTAGCPPWSSGRACRADGWVPAGHLSSSAAGHRGRGWDARVPAARGRQAGRHPPEAFLLRRPQDGRGHHLRRVLLRAGTAAPGLGESGAPPPPAPSFTGHRGGSGSRAAQRPCPPPNTPLCSRSSKKRCCHLTATSTETSCAGTVCATRAGERVPGCGWAAGHREAREQGAPGCQGDEFEALGSFQMCSIPLVRHARSGCRGWVFGDSRGGRLTFHSFPFVP